MISIAGLKKELSNYQNKEKARNLALFFKTGKGEYGEGDMFFGITVPICRNIAKKYTNLSLSSIDKLIKSKIHEERLIAIFILVERYKGGVDKQKKEIYDFYLKHSKNINNWDLVDLSAPKILGDYLFTRDKKILLKLANSKNLWDRRISVIATFQFIYFGKHEWTFKIIKILLKDKHDLIHKACGWMLREVGKRISEKKLEQFLKENVKIMPRTTLRYAIERLPISKRKFYLSK